MPNPETGKEGRRVKVALLVLECTFDNGPAVELFLKGGSEGHGGSERRSEQNGI